MDLLETKNIIQHITNQIKLPRSFAKEFWKIKLKNPLFYKTEFIGIQNHSRIEAKEFKCYPNGLKSIKIWNDGEIICGIEIVENNTKNSEKYGFFLAIIC